MQLKLQDLYQAAFFAAKEFANAGLFWCETPSIEKQVRIAASDDYLYIEEPYDLKNYYSVRCVKD